MRMTEAQSAETIMNLTVPAECHSLWDKIHREAVAVAAAEPALAAWMHEAIINQSNLASALAHLIAAVVGGSSHEKTLTSRLAEQAFRDDPSMIEIAALDLRAPLDRDPAGPGPLHVRRGNRRRRIDDAGRHDRQVAKRPSWRAADRPWRGAISRGDGVRRCRYRRLCQDWRRLAGSCVCAVGVHCSRRAGAAGPPCT